MGKWYDFPHKYAGSTWIGMAEVDYYAAYTSKNSKNEPVFSVIEVWDNNRDNYTAHGEYATLDEAYDAAYWEVAARNCN